MSELAKRRSWTRRILLGCAGLLAFTLLFVIACRIAVQSIFKGIEQSRATGLSAVAWDYGSMWSEAGGNQVSLLARSSTGAWISRSADVRARSSDFDQSASRLHEAVSVNHGYFEDLKTQSRSKEGRVLSALLSVPSAEFDTLLSALKSIGRTEAISQAGEDSAVKLAMSDRHLANAKTNLARLQKLQFERNRQLRDALELEKEIAQANDNLSQAQREHEGLLSTVAQAHIRFTLFEDYRAPLEANWAGASLQMRNAAIEGANAILASIGAFVGVLFEYGLPTGFWIALLLWPTRLAWRRFKTYRLATARA